MALSSVFNRVLVAVDASDMADQVIQALSQFDLVPDSLVVLTHVISPQESGIGQSADVAKPAALLEQIATQLEDYATEIDEIFEHTLDIVTEITEGEPALEIIRLAHIHQARLIILGTRGLTGVSRILQGSVSAQVLEDAPCSVFVVKSSS